MASRFSTVAVIFPTDFYYRLKLDKICRKLRDKYKFKYDINAILSDLIYARILEPASKRSSYKTASEFLENHPTSCMTSTGHSTFLEMNVILSSRKFIKQSSSRKAKRCYPVL